MDNSPHLQSRPATTPPTRGLHTWYPTTAIPRRSHLPADVLVIDDDPAVVTLMISLLESEARLRVRGAYSLAQALEWSPPQPPAMILVAQAFTTGGDVLVRTLRARAGWAHVPVVLCAHPACRRWLLGSSAPVEYLPHPLDLDAVLRLATACASRQSRSSLATC